jgi:inhibitor of the pro-sigma K processing machinery
MENLIPLLLPALVALIVVKLLLKPMKWTLRAVIHGLGGFACLWLVNTTAVFTGLTLPVNAVTVLLTGTLGIPGLALVTLLEML